MARHHRRRPLRDIRAADVKAYSDFLRDKKNVRGGQLRHTTIIKLLGHVKAFTAWAKGAGLLAEDVGAGVEPPEPTRVERDRDEDDEKARRALTTEELRRLFAAPLFAGCAGPARRAMHGPNIIRDDRWWFFVVLHLTGMRVSEFVQAPARLHDFEGVPCIDLRNIKAKTPSGRRLIPLIPDLQRLGFVEWAYERHARGLGLASTSTSPSAWSKWANRYLDSQAIRANEAVVPSLRHNFSDMCLAAGLADQLKDKLMGHTPPKGNTAAKARGRSAAGSVYGKTLSAAEARLVVERLRSPIPLDRLVEAARRA